MVQQAEGILDALRLGTEGSGLEPLEADIVEADEERERLHWLNIVSIHLYCYTLEYWVTAGNK
jgi:hypothetical protein